MPPSLVTAVETPAKYFAKVENQQKWYKKYKTKITIAMMANGKCSSLKKPTVASTIRTYEVPGTFSPSALVLYIVGPSKR